ncbi:mutS protein homolog 5-like [Anabrus simplex]|uniref:mutS protein homolog 5-like n=1 Tax=Anabrus simplex TaxID=316456 RepID=UPI0035A2EF50
MHVFQVILSVYWRKGKLGAAYYNMETNEITILNDTVDINPEFHMLTSLFRQVQPSKVVTSSKMADVFIAALKTLVQEGDVSPGHDLAEQKKFILLPGREYCYELCKRRILSVRLPGEPEDSEEEEHVWYINTVVNLTAESMVLALGTLLNCLDKSFVYLNLEATQRVAPISAVHIISMRDMVMIDTETYEALQVFNQQSHPSNFKRGVPGSNKEGLSLFGLFNRCKTTVGCKYMRVILYHPTRDIAVLNSRLDVVQFCYNPKNDDVVKSLTDSLKSIKNINKVVTRLTAARASVAEWKSLHKTIFHCVTLGEICSRVSSEAELFEKIASCVTEELYQVAHCIDNIVDFPESERQNKFVVKLGVDEELDRKKQKYGGLPAILSTLAHQELDLLPAYVKQCSVVYIPEIRYLLAVPLWKECVTPEDLELPGLDFMFKVGDVVHYKSARCRELDTVLGDCLLSISEHESRIMVKLVQFIQQHLLQIQHLINLCAELDCLIAFGLVARENNYVRPVLSEDRVLEIIEGRHPLQELVAQDFVPNDTYSNDEHGYMKILTGPNASGKSVYLKQVALIAYLAHTGSFVPANRATIGVLDHIHSRIQTVESIATQMSAFTIDVRQMTLSLYNSTPSSLIIIDEFGKGTSEVDGKTLLAACLEHFLSRDHLCPHVFVSTHFHHVTKLLSESSYLSLQTMEYMLDKDGEIVYLYKLKPGSVTSSMSIQVLQSVGVAEKAVRRSSEILEAMRTGSPLTRLEDSRRAKMMSLCEEIVSQFMASDFSTPDLGKLVISLNKLKSL